MQQIVSESHFAFVSKRPPNPRLPFMAWKHKEPANTTARREGRSSDIRWHVCRDQSWVFVEGVLTAIKDESGKVRAYSKIARSARPHHAAGSLVAAILEGTADVIYAVGKNGRFVFANGPATRLFDRRVEELIGRTREQVLPAHIASDMRATDESVMAGTPSRMVEERFPTANGERVMLTTKAPWPDTQGGVVGIVAIGQDVTIRAGNQAERERLLREVRRSNEELSASPTWWLMICARCYGLFGHYAELLAQHMEGRLDATASQFMTLVMDGAQSMQQLIESLLRYATSEEDLSSTTVNVNAVVEGLIQRLEPILNDAQAIVTVDPLPTVHADPARLLQLLQNLIMNAVNYRSSEPPRIHISAETRGAEHQFAVADNGVGITREHFGRIFRPLQRLNARTAGTGIGLALCRRIVERHGGRIWVESTVGKGSTFYFTLHAHA